MHCGFGGGQSTLALHRGNKTVVFGDLRQFAIRQQIEARISNIYNADRIAACRIDECHCYESRTHTREFGIGSRARHQGVIRVLDCPHQHISTSSGEFGVKCLKREMTCNLAGLMAAHAIGHSKKAIDHEVGILIRLANASGVRGCAPRELSHCISMTVLPICTTSPGLITIGPATLCRFNHVPFVEPRSSICH